MPEIHENYATYAEVAMSPTRPRFGHHSNLFNYSQWYVKQTNSQMLGLWKHCLMRLLSHLEWKAVIWLPHEMKYKLMFEQIQNKFVTFLYFKYL